MQKESINIISDSGESEFFCRLCVNRKLFLFDKPNQLYKCPNCGSLFKYYAPTCKPKISIDSELDSRGQSTILFKDNKKSKKDDYPELSGNYIIKQESEHIPS